MIFVLLIIKLYFPESLLDEATEFLHLVRWHDMKKCSISVTMFHGSQEDLTIIPRTRIGCELSDSGRGAEHLVGYHKLISNKHEWNNCFIKYQILAKNISNFIFHRNGFSSFLRETFP